MSSCWFWIYRFTWTLAENVQQNISEHVLLDILQPGRKRMNVFSLSERLVIKLYSRRRKSAVALVLQRTPPYEIVYILSTYRNTSFLAAFCNKYHKVKFVSNVLEVQARKHTQFHFIAMFVDELLESMKTTQLTESKKTDAVNVVSSVNIRWCSK